MFFEHISKDNAEALCKWADEQARKSRWQPDRVAEHILSIFEVGKMALALQDKVQKVNPEAR